MIGGRLFARIQGLHGWRADLCALGLGAVSAAALPPFHLVPILLLAVPGLLALIEGTRGAGGAFRRGFLFGLGHHIVGLYWITEAILLESARYWWLVPFAVPALSALLALFIAAPCAVAKRAEPGWRRVAALAGAWVLFDLARQYVGTGFPWNPWGSVWAFPGVAGDVMLQPLAWIGTPGLTLATLLLAGAAMLSARGALLSAAALLVWAGLGWKRVSEPAAPSPGIDAVIVQGNVKQGQKWDSGAAAEAFDRQLALTRAGVAEAGDHKSVVVWPETSTFYLLQYDPAARAALADAARPAVAALVGGLTFDERPTAANLANNAPRNSLIGLGPTGDITAIYSKWHLVPFGEYAPSWVPLAIKIVPGTLAFGTGPSTLTVPGLPPFGPLICYEAVFPAQVVDEGTRPRWIVNITNDAWFGNSTGPRQHLAAARMRAVEEGLPLVRSANTGISVVFDARGHEEGRLGIGVAGTLVLPIPGARPATSFSRWGLVIPGVLSAVWLVLGLRRRR
ncbi:MAG: apolipoprotein N-acyltransferase [Acetobacteraceae bacterium]|nr:apolipoprotein N-acyltransferase [Acetobacteraceae bacterium]